MIFWGSVHLKQMLSFVNQNKTELFDFSLETFEANGFALSEVTRDLHKEDAPRNIVTEYEQNFVSQGVPIKRLVAKVR